MKLFLLAATSMLLCAAPAGSRAQLATAYPNKSIRMVVPRDRKSVV